MTKTYKHLCRGLVHLTNLLHVPLLSFPITLNFAIGYTVLLNKVKRGKEQTFRPSKIYYYYGLREALSTLVKRPSFLDVFNLWLKSKNHDDIMGDITDGNIWKEFVFFVTRKKTNQSFRIVDECGLVPTIQRYIILCWSDLCSDH